MSTPPELIRTKFRVTTVDEHVGGGADIWLEAVTSGSTENEQFFQHTPLGNLRLSVVSAELVDVFDPNGGDDHPEGREFYVDFTPAD